MKQLKKYVIFLLIILTVTGCRSINETKNSDAADVDQSQEVTTDEGSKETTLDLKIFGANHYLADGENSVRFFFETNKENKIDFYIAKASQPLKRVISDADYTYEEGLKVTGLEKGQRYDYEIHVKNQGEIEKSKKLAFTFHGLDERPINAKWAKEAIFYEIFVRSFYDSDGDGIGDFNGIHEKLDYIEELGVTALWLMPTTDSPSYHGYDIVDYKSVNPDYGTLEDFQNLIESAHERDIKIIMDYVINHTSSEHPWFKEALNDNEAFKDYYVWANDFTNIKETGEWGQRIWHTKNNKDYYMGIFWGEMPDLNLKNPKVREEIKDIAKFWLDLGIDGFRLDASKHIDDESPKVTHLWWQDFNAYVKDQNPQGFLVGENWDSNINIIAPFFNDMDASFNFALSEGIIETVNNQYYGNILEDLLEMRQRFSDENPDFIDATFIRNHDQSRTASILFDNTDKTKLAASIHLTFPGTPFIYYGEELGQKGKKPDENIREPFDWYQGAQGEGMTNMIQGGFGQLSKYTHENDGISVEEQMNDNQSLLNHYKKLISIRKKYPELFNGNYEIIDLNDKVLAYTVENKLLIIHSLSRKEKMVNVKSYISDESQEILKNIYLEDEITLKPYESLIITLP